MPLTDARTLPEASLIEGDIIIIGGGMAGLAIAHEFAGTAVRVVVLESGGPEPDLEIQSLYDGTGVMSGPGEPDLPFNDYLGQSRVRALGGSVEGTGELDVAALKLFLEDRDQPRCL